MPSVCPFGAAGLDVRGCVRGCVPTTPTNASLNAFRDAAVGLSQGAAAAEGPGRCRRGARLTIQRSAHCSRDDTSDASRGCSYSNRGSDCVSSPPQAASPERPTASTSSTKASIRPCVPSARATATTAAWARCARRPVQAWAGGLQRLAAARSPLTLAFAPSRSAASLHVRLAHTLATSRADARTRPRAAVSVESPRSRRSFFRTARSRGWGRQLLNAMWTRCHQRRRRERQ